MWNRSCEDEQNVITNKAEGRTDRSVQRRVRGSRATGETRHVPEAPGSWDSRHPLLKNEKSADLAHYFSEEVTFCERKKITSTLRGQRQD